MVSVSHSALRRAALQLAKQLISDLRSFGIGLEIIAEGLEISLQLLRQRDAVAASPYLYSPDSPIQYSLPAQSTVSGKVNLGKLIKSSSQKIYYIFAEERKRENS